MSIINMPTKQPNKPTVFLRLRSKWHIPAALALLCLTIPLVASAHHDDESHHGDVDIGVVIAPQTEHWPSNYVPDNYNLQDYDGKPNHMTICAGPNGRTLSTADRACPAGQSRSQQGHNWSTTDAN